MNPRSIAVVGASEDQSKFGGRLYRMLLKHAYGGTVYPINPGRESLFGIPAWPSIDALPAAPDMVVMALPRDKVKAQIEAAAQRGAQGAIIITAKFADAGPEGAALEREIVDIARASGMRLIGPNCLGLISAANQVVLCSSPALDRERLPISPIGLVSQSGALMATIFDRAWDNGIGFTHGVSVGNQADLELCDFVDYLIADERTKVICTYIEGIRDPQRFIEVARRARAAGKPWLAVKAGSTEAGSKAAFSHTASIAGSHEVLAAICRDEGITLMEDVNAMVLLASALSRHAQAAVRRVAIFTTSGGGGALAADALASRGLELAAFTAQTQAHLGEWYTEGQAQNPVDIGGRKFDGGADIVRETMAALTHDANTDALLIPITTAPTMAGLAGELVQALGSAPEKPAFIVMQPGSAANAARQVLLDGGLPFANTVGEAIEALAAWSTRAPGAAIGAEQRPADLAAPTPAPTGVLNEAQSKALLQHYGIPVSRDLIADSAGQAVEHARTLGYPVVMKIVSPDVVHKSDSGGVMLNVGNDAEVAQAWERIIANVRQAVPDARIEGVSIQNQASGNLEMIIGARRDAQFGPILVIGAGGVLVELLPARCILRAPAAASHVRQLLQTLPIWPLLAGYRGKPLNVDAVVNAVVRAGWLAADLAHDEFEFDINPLIVSPEGCIAVDARLRVGHHPETQA